MLIRLVDNYPSIINYCKQNPRIFVILSSLVWLYNLLYLLTYEWNTGLDNTTYDILSALGRVADFLYDTIDKYIDDAKKSNNNELVGLWNRIKQDD